MNEPVMKKPMTGGGAGGPQDYQPPPGQFHLNADRTLSGQQMQALAQSHAAALAGIKRDVELRKWAVDQAVAFNDTAAASGTNLMKVARDIHAFLVEGAEKE